MTQFLVMTAEQAVTCSGEFCPGKAIAPRPMLDGRYALPIRLLGIPACLAAFPLLTSLSAEELLPDAFVEEE